MKPGHVDKPLLLCLGLGIAAGVMIGIATFFWWLTETYMLINRTLNYVGCALGFIVFPATMSLVAKRNYFWWGLATSLLAFSVARVVDSVFGFQGEMITMRLAGFGFIDYMGPTGLPDYFATYAVAGTIASAGLISLTRYVVQHRQKSTNMLDVQEISNSAGNGDAWPPAPRGD